MIAPETLSVEQVADVDPRDLYAEFDRHNRGCMPCATAPSGLLLCPIGAELFERAMGKVGLEPTQADANALTLDLSELFVPEMDVELMAWEVDGTYPWADADALDRWRAARRFRGFNGLVRVGLLTDWPSPSESHT